MIKINKITSLSIPNLITYLSVVYAFILPLSRGLISMITALLLVLFLFDKNLKQRLLLILHNKVLISVIIFYLFTFSSLLWSDNIKEGLVYLRRYWYLLIMFVFTIYLKKEDIPKIISAFLLGMLISEILSYGIFFELWHMKHGTPSDPTPFMNHLQYSMFLAFTSLLLLNKSFFGTKNKFRIFYFIYFLMTTSSLFINGGRTGQFAFLISIFTVGFLNMKNKLLSIVSMLLLLGTILTVAYQFSPVFQVRISSTNSEIQKLLHHDKSMYHVSFGERLAAWEIGLDIFKDKPLIGTGVGSEMDALKEKIDFLNIKAFKIDTIYNIKHYHSNYVTYLVQLGIIGLILYLHIFYRILTLPIQNREINNLKYIFIIVFMTSSLFEQMFYAQFPLALFGFFTGIFIVASTKNIDIAEK